MSEEKVDYVTKGQIKEASELSQRIADTFKGSKATVVVLAMAMVLETMSRHIGIDVNRVLDYMEQVGKWVDGQEDKGSVRLGLLPTKGDAGDN